MNLLFTANLGYIASGALSSESYNRLQELESGLYNDMIDTYYPSMVDPEKEKEDVQKKDVVHATKLWEDAFGNLNDPEVQFKIKELASRLSAPTGKPRR